jgi:hypothetical protein
MISKKDFEYLERIFVQIDKIYPETVRSKDPQHPHIRRYSAMVERLLSQIDLEFAAELRARDTYNLSKSGRQRSNRRLRTLQLRRQRCLQLL